MENKIKSYEKKGGEFVSSPFSVKERVIAAKAIIFDWDGVFHSGYKNETRSSAFSEADSMGVNMLRFGLYLESASIPYTAVVTGENNPTAQFWANREHLDAVFHGIKDKVTILDYLKRERGIEADEVIFVFDDILDLSLAAKVGARFMVNRAANPRFIEYCKQQKYVDYLTYSTGAEHAVREVCEVCLTLMGKLNETIEKRIEYSGEYTTYINKRNEIQTNELGKEHL